MDITLLQFFHRVLPAQGNFYYLAIKRNPKRDSKDHKPVPDAFTLAATVTNKDKQGHTDVWFSVGSFTTSREAKNAVAKKCFYIDIDVGPGKPYQTVREAIKDLITKLKAAGLPLPTIIVVSGNGIHGYWTLLSEVTIAQWNPVAIALEAKLKEIGVMVDTTVTTDASRVLRVPGTRNWKDINNPKECRIVEQLCLDHDYDYEFLQQAFGAIQSGESALPFNGIPADNDDLIANTIIAQHPPEPARPMLKRCPMYRSALLTKGAGVSEPLWNLQLMALAFTQDGEKYIHAISSGHKDYSKQETEQKFAQKQQHMHQLSGPPQCDTFAKHAAECSTGCPHHGVVKNPVMLSRHAEVTLPQGYFQNSGGVWRRLEGVEGNPVKRVLPCKIVKGTLVNASLPGGTGGGLEITFEFSPGHTHTMITSTSNDPRGWAKELGYHTVALQTHEVQEAANFMAVWIEQMRNTRQAVDPITQFGWVKERGKTGFALGNQVFWEDSGTRQSIVRIDQAVGGYYEATGDADVWMKAADRIVRHSPPEYQVALASAFAAPLMKLTGISGVLLSLVSPKSGTGKSTVLQMAQAVWGDPKRGVNALNDTGNAVAHKMGIINNLPAYWDELRVHADVKQFLKLVFTVGQGKEKSRMTGAVGAAKTGSWATMITSASNESVIGHIDDAIIGSDAGRYRVFEIELNQTGHADALANRLFASVQENYGHAGVTYARWLAANHENVQERINAKLEFMGEKLSPTRDERFWIAMIAAILTGAEIAKELGIVNFDYPAMRKYLVKKLASHRHAMGAVQVLMDPVETIRQFIQDIAANTVTTDRIATRGFADVGLLGTVAPRTPYLAQWAVDDKVILISVTALRDWMHQRRDNFQRVIQGLKGMGVDVDHRARLGSGALGLQGALPKIRTIKLDLTHPNFTDFDQSADYLDDSSHERDSETQDEFEGST